MSKSNSSGSTSYRYDGQMGMEDIDFASNGSVSKVTDYGLGARGVDALVITQGGSSSTIFPLYDAHGNMVYTLSRGAGGTFSYSTVRTFDAWGSIRKGGQSGDPKGRFCANLGHKQDDESDLIFMRARYYEPTTGRFVSQDPAHSGINWFAYCGNDPVSYVDRTGKWLEDALGAEAVCVYNLAACVSAGDAAGAIFWIELISGCEVSDAVAAAITAAIGAGVRLRASAGGLAKGDSYIDNIAEHVNKIADVLALNPNADVNSMVREIAAFFSNWINKVSL